MRSPISIFALGFVAIIGACGNSTGGSNETGNPSWTDPDVRASLVRGKDAYVACAVCHLDSGEGVPGAFPSLLVDVETLAVTDGGRKYLAGAIQKGLQGKISTSQGDYNAVMPAQAAGADSQSTSDVLNYVLSEYTSKFSLVPFTVEEAETLLAETKPLTAAELAAARPETK